VQEVDKARPCSLSQASNSNSHGSDTDMLSHFESARLSTAMGKFTD
jgi:hypothetical protein